MIKKIPFLFIFLIASIAFSQEKSIGKFVASPNPFSSSTTISFNSLQRQNVLVIVKNVLGKTVFTKRLDAKIGENKIPFNRNNLRAGMYVYAIQSNKDFLFKRFVIR